MNSQEDLKAYKIEQFKRSVEQQMNHVNSMFDGLNSKTTTKSKYLGINRRYPDDILGFADSNFDY